MGLKHTKRGEGGGAAYTWAQPATSNRQVWAVEAAGKDRPVWGRRAGLRAWDGMPWDGTATNDCPGLLIGKNFRNLCLVLEDLADSPTGWRQGGWVGLSYKLCLPRAKSNPYQHPHPPASQPSLITKGCHCQPTHQSINPPTNKPTNPLYGTTGTTGTIRTKAG